jgi:tetratricopeptide (TPR) repeat protein
LYEKALKIYRSIDSGSVESRTLVTFIKLNGNEDDLCMKADTLSYMGVMCEKEARTRSFDNSEDSKTPIYDDQSKVEKALDYLQQALYIYQKLGYRAREWNIIFYIGKIDEDQDNEEKAKEAYLKVLEIAYEIDDIEAETWIIEKTSFRQYFNVDHYVYRRWIGDYIPYDKYGYYGYYGVTYDYGACGAGSRNIFSGGGNSKP